jgi:hypothetical protein
MELRWHAISGPAGLGPKDALYVGGTEVARVTERLSGGWLAILRYPNREPVTRPCTSYSAGRAGCEAWSRRHGEALERHAERRHLEWLATQMWRGDACSDARLRLAELEANSPGIPAEARPAR